LRFPEQISLPPRQVKMNSLRRLRRSVPVLWDFQERPGSGVRLDSMIDWHSHILPGVDDGPTDIVAALRKDRESH
jgi:hypothetical protein